LHYKALLETGKKKKNEKKIYLRSETGIVGLLNIISSMKYTKLLCAQQITLEEFRSKVSEQS